MFNSRMVKYNRQVWTIWFCQDPVSHSGGVRAVAGHWHSTNSLSMTKMPFSWNKIGDIQNGWTSQGEGSREEKVAHAREKEKIGGSSGNENCNSVIRKPLSKVTVKSHRPYSSTIRFENGLQMDANGSSESEFLEGLSCYCIVDLGAGLAHSGPACGVPPMLHGWLHFNYSSCWCTWRVNAIHGKNCCMDHIFFVRSFLAYTTPSLSKLLQALGQAFQWMILNSKPTGYSFSISTASQSELA